MYSSHVEHWKKELTKHVSTKKHEPKALLTVRDLKKYWTKMREKQYRKYIKSLDKKIADCNKVLIKECVHPYKLLTVTHAICSEGNEINYSTEYIGDSFIIECECGVRWNFYWDEYYHNQWKQDDIQKLQKKFDKKLAKERAKLDKEEFEERERQKYKELKEKYGDL